MERTQKNVRLGLTSPLGTLHRRWEAKLAREHGIEETWLADPGGVAYALSGSNRAAARHAIGTAGAGADAHPDGPAGRR